MTHHPYNPTADIMHGIAAGYESGAIARVISIRSRVRRLTEADTEEQSPSAKVQIAAIRKRIRKLRRQERRLTHSA